MLYRQGHLALARAEFDAVLTVQWHTFSEQHPVVLTTRQKLARVLHDQGHVDGARSELEALLTIRQSTIGKDHVVTLNTRCHLAWVLRSQGDTGRARTELEAVPALCRVPWGHHPDANSARHRLAQVLHDQGLIPRARRLLGEVVAAYEVDPGPEHPFTQAARADLDALTESVPRS
ncbi:tetratricopeptide repeat protein [Streptomyces sp. NPDC054863]